MTELTQEKVLEFGYPASRQLPDGTWIGVRPMFYTGGLFVGLDDTGYRRRYCYETVGEALVALVEWDGEGDPPGKWIKEKGGQGGDRLNPALAEETF